MTDNSISVITSCSAEGWKQYGQRFVESFYTYWPSSVELFVASEEANPGEELPPFHIFPKNLVVDKYKGLPPYYFIPLKNEFLDKYKDAKWTAGDASSPRPPHIMPSWKATSGYFFRYDAYKFCKKVFAIEAAAKLVPSGRLFWIDADVVTFAPIPETIGQTMLPSGYALSCLARGAYHSECGFVGYNLDDVRARQFIANFSNLYYSDQIFELKEWHDSWVFDWLRKRDNVSTYLIPHASTSHPFINSYLGRYMDHMKGSRKERGRSLPAEQKKHTDVDYWR